MELSIKNLCKSYNKKVALDDFSLELTEGIYGLLGPNGSGKSTLMNCLTDNIKRTSGSILFDGKEVLDMGVSYRKIIGYMPQQQGFYENFSAYRFLYYIAGLKGMKRAEAKKQIDELLEIVNLTDAAHRKMGSFSGGMKQRALLVSALLDNPKIVILDEPTAGLDPEERVNLRNYIAKIAENKIVLISTHVVSDIETIANRIVLIKDGRLVKDGTPEELITSVEGRTDETNLEDVYLYYLKKR